MNRSITTVTGLFIIVSATAQDLSTIGLKKGVRLNGGVNITNVYYTSNDSIKRRDPYQLMLSGNLNLKLFGYDMPFSFTYTNSQKSYTQPFNRLSLSPQYKWVKAYLGYTSMSFSPYTLSGHSFLGGGAELSPGNWRIAFMAGRLKKAIEYEPLNSQVVPAYRRMGYGLKLGYEKGFGSISANVFSAKDIGKSIKQSPPDGSLHPMQNVAIGFSGRTTILKHIMLDAEYSVSILNGDLRMKSASTDSTAIANDNPLSSQTPATRTFDAYSCGIGYQASPFGIMLRYERIAPDYQTLGAYYFNSDMENVTVAPNVRLLKGRLSIAGNAGLQRNNLDKSRESTTKRWVGAGNINYNPSEHWNIALNYSNFSTYTRIKPQTDPFYRNEMDSLNFYQVTNNMGSSVNYTFGKNEAPHGIMLNASYQQIKETNPSGQDNNLSDFITSNLSYSRVLPKPGISAGVSYNMNVSNAPETKSFYHGPALNISKMFLEKKLRAGINSTYNQSKINGEAASPVLSNGLNISYYPKQSALGKHNLTFNINWLQRLKSELQQYRSELTLNLNYAFTF